MANEQIKNGAVIAEINGIKYFKLQSKYPGDYTKNCGLLGNEIDENFYFLRSKDISGITFEDKKLVATRVDGEVIDVDMSDVYKPYTFELDRKNGILIVHYPDGREDKIEGFLVEGKAVKVATDSTLIGNGSTLSPVGLSTLETTGTYSPVNEIITGKLGTGHYKGERVIWSGTVSNYGYLYTFDGVKAINNALAVEGHGWRVPSRTDWAELLNAAEEKDNRNHDVTVANVWLGKDAGARAKSAKEWEKSDRMEPEKPEKGEKQKPVGGEDNLPATGVMGTFHVLPVGECESIGIYGSGQTELQGFGRSATFWTSSETHSMRRDSKVFEESNDCSDVVFPEGVRNVYTRTFAFNTRKVKQEASNPDSLYSLRLVKDYTYDDNKVEEYENILGQQVKCVLISNEEENYSKVWTSVNIGVEGFSGQNDFNEWKQGGEGSVDSFFIAEWDGSVWHKKALKEGDSVVILNAKNKEGKPVYNHEWRVSSGASKGRYVLVDCTGASAEDFDKEVKRLDARISTETKTRIEEDAKLADEISGLTIERVDANALSGDVREAYKLVDKAGNQHGELIKIYNDEKIHNITTDTYSGHTVDADGNISRRPDAVPCDVLIIVYKKEDGKYNLVEINLDELFHLNAGNGIEFKDGKIHVKINPNSDSFLSVGEDGLLLSGVTDLVSGITELSAWTVNRVGSGFTAGSITEVIVENELVVASALTVLNNKISGATKGIQELSGNVISLSSATIDIDNKLISEIDRAKTTEHELFKNDIKTTQPEMTVNGLKLERENGNLIEIPFYGNFGLI